MLPLVLVCACTHQRWHTELSQEDADANERSARRTMIGGRAFRDCALDPRPASGVRVELVDPMTNETLASDEADASGHFVLRSPYVEHRGARRELRAGSLRVRLPANAADQNFQAVLTVPCEAREGPTEVDDAPRGRVPLARAAATSTSDVIVHALTATVGSGPPPPVELDVTFELDSARLSSVSDAQLAQVAAALNSPGLAHARVVIHGYADALGSPQYNDVLSLRRAESVVRALVERFAVPARRLRAVGHGESAPRASNATPAGRALNRRVMLTLDPEPG
ncbi:OmpA family protein [Myxococcota bacterium]|nr:OmpA family protein [Myxococcota bacterium]